MQNWASSRVTAKAVVYIKRKTISQTKTRLQKCCQGLQVGLLFFCVSWSLELGIVFKWQVVYIARHHVHCPAGLILVSSRLHCQMWGSFLSCGDHKLKSWREQKSLSTATEGLVVPPKTPALEHWTLSPLCYYQMDSGHVLSAVLAAEWWQPTPRQAKNWYSKSAAIRYVEIALYPRQRPIWMVVRCR